MTQNQNLEDAEATNGEFSILEWVLLLGLSVLLFGSVMIVSRQCQERPANRKKKNKSNNGRQDIEA